MSPGSATRWVQFAGLALTLNFVVTRQNTEQLGAMLRYADEQGVARAELAPSLSHPSRHRLDARTLQQLR